MWSNNYSWVKRQLDNNLQGCSFHLHYSKHHGQLNILSFDICSQASPRLEENEFCHEDPGHSCLGQNTPILCVLYLQYVHCELLIALSMQMPVTCSSVDPGFNDTSQQALKLIVLGSSPCLGWLIPRIQAVLDYELVSSSDILVVLFVNGT